jgi:hypothetical protein
MDEASIWIATHQALKSVPHSLQKLASGIALSPQEGQNAIRSGYTKASGVLGDPT